MIGVHAKVLVYQVYSSHAMLSGEGIRSSREEKGLDVVVVLYCMQHQRPMANYGRPTLGFVDRCRDRCGTCGTALQCYFRCQFCYDGLAHSNSSSIWSSYSTGTSTAARTSRNRFVRNISIPSGMCSFRRLRSGRMNACCTDCGGGKGLTVGEFEDRGWFTARFRMKNVLSRGRYNS